MSTAICPFSGDPITYGHIDLIERAANTFDSVVAAVGINPLKQYLFNTDERLQMAREALKHLPNVEVDSYEGLLADFARQKGIHTIVRGIRNSEDFNYEWQLHQINESIDATLETLWLPCSTGKQDISSSAVKLCWQQGNDVSGMVPLVVVRMMQARNR
ncbi:MAG TPA: pantetheine-phosphate adenylyltransferase [Chitinophagales bacterium]|nr:pantetheine-phosphate adenylyltransferase [Chitinophagales bacterium]